MWVLSSGRVPLTDQLATFSCTFDAVLSATVVKDHGVLRKIEAAISANVHTFGGSFLGKFKEVICWAKALAHGSDTVGGFISASPGYLTKVAQSCHDIGVLHAHAVIFRCFTKACHNISVSHHSCRNILELCQRML
jgi:hypothetical protein